MILGLYFVLLRPPLLPIDLRSMGTSLAQVQAAGPNLTVWLRRVFWVMGGYMFTTGMLTFYVAHTTFRVREVADVMALAGQTSVGLMAVVNIICSDFKWLILSFGLPWAFAVALYWIERDHPLSPEPSSSS